MNREQEESGKLGAFYLLMLALIIMLILAMIRVRSPDDVRIEAEQYCHMVAIHNQNSKLGWPDYHHVFTKQCHNDGSVNQTYLQGN